VAGHDYALDRVFINRWPTDVRLSDESGMKADMPGGPRRARNGHRPCPPRLRRSTKPRRLRHEHRDVQHQQTSISPWRIQLSAKRLEETADKGRRGSRKNRLRFRSGVHPGLQAPLGPVAGPVAVQQTEPAGLGSAQPPL
jgi:hypothetical protein